MCNVQLSLDNLCVSNSLLIRRRILNILNTQVVSMNSNAYSPLRARLLLTTHTISAYTVCSYIPNSVACCTDMFIATNFIYFLHLLVELECGKN